MNENLEHGPTENRILDVNCETHVEGIDPRAGELARATKIALTRVYAPWNPRVCVFFFFFLLECKTLRIWMRPFASEAQDLR